MTKKRISRSEKSKQKRGVDHGTPFSQRWIYDFYDHFHDELLPSQKFILNKVLEGLSGEDTNIKESSATKIEKSRAIQIIHQVLARAERKIRSVSSKKKDG